MPLSAQTVSLSGRVLDESGAAVPAAKVELRDTDSGAALRTISSADGAYRFGSLTPGHYTVSASTAALITPEPYTIGLQSGAQSLDLRLRVAPTAQSLIVNADAGPAVSTDAASNASATVVKGNELDALADDPDDLQSDLQALAGPSAGPGGSQILVDGFTSADLPPKTSIREVRVNQNPFSPDYDKLGLGRVEVFTRPGTDKYHALIAYNFGSDIWNSRNPYAAIKAPFLLQEPQASVSGPLSKRTSFTLDLSKQTVDNGSITSGITLAPVSLQPVPFSTVVTTPQRRFLVVPRLDYQLGEGDFLTVNYNFTGAHVEQAGVGGFDLSSRGYDERNHFNTLRMTETSIRGSAVNETRFLYFHWHNESTPDDPSSEIQVLGAFNGGGAANPGDHYTEARYELQNNTYIVRGKHSLRFGGRLRGQTMDSYVEQNFAGTFTYSTIQQYRDTLLGLPGAGPSLFTVSAGMPDTKVAQTEPALFAGDDWRLRQNLTVSLGLRYESQTNIRDHLDFGPRLGLAWSPATRAGKTPTLVFRAGFGIFYDRFSLTNTLAADRNNGIVQQQYVVLNPTFTTAPPLASLETDSEQARQELFAGLRAPYLMQSAFTAERQLARGATLAATWTNAHGLHQLRSEFLLNPGQGPVFLMSSSGLFNQNQFLLNLNQTVNNFLSLFSSYTLSKALSNTDGLSTYPGDPYNYSGEYGPAATDIRHRFLLGGSVAVPGNIRLSPLITLQSGAPFNITTGTDPYGTTLYFSRPGLNGTLQTPYGLLDPNPVPGEPTIGRNAGRGPALFAVNLRAARDWKPRGRINLSLGVSARNLLNHNNPGPIVGVLSSPLFGQSNQIAGDTGPGFSQSANNRHVELQLRLAY